MMDEENAIVTFLESSPETWFSRKEIARKAVRRRVYEADPNWLNTPLDALLARKIVEQNASGCYKINRSI